MNRTYSKTITLYLSPAAYKAARKIAKALGQSLNAYIRSLIDADIAARNTTPQEKQS